VSSASGVREDTVIAVVRRGLLMLDVVTRYQPRTDVERWQLQDRLGLRIRQLGCEAPPRFFEAADGRLAFRLRLGWRPPEQVVAALGDIDEHPDT